jgi:hypothetical protein
MDALLAGDAPRTAAEARRALLVADLRAATLHAPETLHARVAAARPARKRAFVQRPSWKLVALVVPAALGIAVTAAVVHGLTGSSGGKNGQPVAAKRASTPPDTFSQNSPFSESSGSGAIGTVPAPNTDSSAIQAQKLAPTVSGSSSRLQHTEASIQIRVPDADHLSSATTAATRIATSLGGYAQSVDYRTPQHGAPAAYLELRVPAQNVQKALARLGGLGTIVSQQISVQDLQHALEVESAQVAQLRRRIAALAQAVRNPALPEAQRVLLRIKLVESRRALSQRLHARSGTVAAGTTARISLVLGTKQSVVTPVSHHRGPLGRKLHSALGFLAIEGMVVLYALIVISPFAAIGGLAWALARLRRRRDERRLLAVG